MGTVTGMLAEARKTIGLRESPPGSNHNTIVDWYNTHVARIGNGPWCDMAITYWAAHSGNATAVGQFAYTPSHVNWFKARGRWHNGISGIRAGDIVFFDWDGGVVDHVGVVEKVLGDGRIQTIEGNTSDVCARRIRASGIAGYGRPAYATTTTQEKDMDPSTNVKVGETWDKTFDHDAYPAGYLWVESVARGRRIEAQIAALAAAQGVDVDEDAIVKGVLAGLEPASIAALVVDALPPDLAKQVADELATRLEN
jgi:hypothetical protein